MARKILENIMKTNYMELVLELYQNAKFSKFRLNMVQGLVMGLLNTLMEMFSMVNYSKVPGIVTELI
jgi:hypothetical protein